MAILEPFALAIGFLLSYVYDFTLSYGFAIAILTVIINVIIFPLTLRQTRSTKRMQDAQSDIKKLQKQHKDGRAHVWTPVTQWSRMPSSAWKKKTKKNKKKIKKKKK